MSEERRDLSDINLTYEEAYAELEQILIALESGDLPLEESLTLYERGSMLSAYCAKQLDDAELRVQQWQPDGLKPFEEWRDSSGASA